MKRLFISPIVIVSVLISAFAFTNAFFSDTETSSGNVLGAGSVDLLVGNTSYYNGVFNTATSWLRTNLDTNTLFLDFNDVKPSDWGEDTIELYVDDNDSYVCAEIDITANDDNGSTEPELLVDIPDDLNNNFDGELATQIYFSFWADDGDNVLETDEIDSVFSSDTALASLSDAQWTVADSQSNIFTNSGGPLLGATPYYIGKFWCFGEMNISAVNQDNLGFTGNQNANGPDVRGSGFSCDGSGLGNETQTDIVKGNVTFSAVQARNNTDFRCFVETSPTPVPSVSPSPTVTPSPSPTPVPTPIACVEDWADSVVFSSQGVRKNGTAVLPDRSNTAAILGISQTTGTPTDAGFPAGSFYSLGFKLNQPEGGVVTVAFDNPVYDQVGNDLQIFEVTGCAYPDENIKVEVSQDNTVFTPVVVSGSRDVLVDINPLPWVQYVRITDVSNINNFPDLTADAYDLDAVKAFCALSQ